MRVLLAAAAAVDPTAPSFWVGVLVGALATAAVALSWWGRTRRRATAAALRADAEAEQRPVAATPVRRPVYLARPLLNDLLAHAEPRDFGRGLRASLADDDLDGIAGDTRLLNKVIAGLRRQRHLIDLDADPSAPLASGRPLLVTGTVTEHPANTLRAADQEPVGARTTGATQRSTVPQGSGGRTRRRTAPLLITLTDDRSGRTYTGVVDARRLRREDGAWMSSPVSMLAVIDDVLSSQDQVPVADVLAEHVPAPPTDGAAPVQGPGAVVSVGAIFR